MSRNTAWSLSRDLSRAKLSTLRELALAEGKDLRIMAVPAGDPAASAAARILVGDIDDDVHDPSVDEWTQRLTRWVPDGAPLDLVTEAATVSAPHHRPGAVLLTGRRDADRLLSAAAATGGEWAFSGAIALEHLMVDEPLGVPAVVWTEQPRRFREMLGTTHTEAPAIAAATVVLAPVDQWVLSGAATIDDAHLVTPVQLVLDLLGIGGASEAAALSLAKEW